MAGLPGGYAVPTGALLLATAEDQPAGCAGLRPFPLEGACKMKRLYVVPQFRGEGLGQALIERILTIARRLNYTRLRLDTQPDSMQAAVELYRRFGFKEVAAKRVHGAASLARTPPFRPRTHHVGRMPSRHLSNRWVIYY